VEIVDSNKQVNKKEIKMANNTGEIDWNEADLPSGKGGKNDFMRLKEGENVVRIMGNPVQSYIHWITLPDGQQRKIVSPNNPALVKKLEDAGFRRQPNWLIKVLDRADEQFRLLEVGNQIFKGIQTLFNNPKWGKVTNYDISINRGPKGQQPLYTVTPNPKEPVDSSVKQKFVEFNDRINLDKLITPMPSQDICKLLGINMPKDKDEESEPKTASTKTGGNAKKFEFEFES
jgi:hypothetical protein